MTCKAITWSTKRGCWNGFQDAANCCTGNLRSADQWSREGWLDILWISSGVYLINDKVRGCWISSGYPQGLLYFDQWLREGLLDILWISSGVVVYLINDNVRGGWISSGYPQGLLYFWSMITWGVVGYPLDILRGCCISDQWLREELLEILCKC